MNRIPFEELLGEHVQEVATLDPGYSGHASDVWRVKTATREVIVRSSRLKDEPDNDFWWGCKRLFGIDPRHTVYMEASSRLLNTLDTPATIRAPRILAKAEISGREYLVVEKMPGHVLPSFKDRSDELLYHFGQWLAQVHRNTYPEYGNLAGTKRTALDHFHHDMRLTIDAIMRRYYQGSGKIEQAWKKLMQEMVQLPNVTLASPVLIDMDPSQFLYDHHRITAIVDTEAYVLGPRELDFVGLEYVLDYRSSLPFLEGYSSLMDVPDLSQVRRAYRFFYRVLSVQGSVPLDEWVAQPELF